MRIHTFLKDPPYRLTVCATAFCVQIHNPLWTNSFTHTAMDILSLLLCHTVRRTTFECGIMQVNDASVILNRKITFSCRSTRSVFHISSRLYLERVFLISGMFRMLCMRMRSVLYSNASLAYTHSPHNTGFISQIKQSFRSEMDYCAFAVIRLIV